MRVVDVVAVTEATIERVLVTGMGGEVAQRLTHEGVVLMALHDVEIVTDQTRPLSQAGFGLPLIFGTEGDKPHQEYTSIQAVAEDYADERRIQGSRMIFTNSRDRRVACYSIDRAEPNLAIWQLRLTSSYSYTMTGTG